MRHQQQGSLISAALANAAPAINRAGEGAARDNFNQAYAKAEVMELHEIFLKFSRWRDLQNVTNIFF